MESKKEKQIELKETLVDGKPSGVEEEQEDDSLEIFRPFDPEKIKVSKVTRTIQLIVSRIDHDEIDLEPDFQRRARIWPKERKSRLIESLLLRIPLPVFYVAADVKENWTVVDGLQRLTTIFDFCKGEFELTNLEYLTQLDGLSFDTLPRHMMRRVEETELNINVIEPGTPQEVMFNIFKRINTGGVPLNGQEIRNALNRGAVRKFLIDLVSLDAFKQATADSINDARMAARECALRFCAFIITPWKKYEGNDLDGFLQNAMRQINEMPDGERAVVAKSFERSMNAAARIFKEDAFRKRYSPDDNRKPISKPLFEAWSVNLANRTNEEIEVLVSRRDDVVSKYLEKIRNDGEFERSISYSTSGAKHVHKRFSAVREIIEGVLGLP